MTFCHQRDYLFNLYLPPDPKMENMTLEPQWPIHSRDQSDHFSNKSEKNKQIKLHKLLYNIPLLFKKKYFFLKIHFHAQSFIEEVKWMCVIRFKPEAPQPTCGCSSIALPTSQNKTGSIFALPCVVLSLPIHHMKQ